MVISQETQARLKELVSVFLRENSQINLSAFRTEENCWIGNVLDSLAALDTPPFQNLSGGLKILDLGTGGGFPLLPLAICLPGCTFVGIDSVQKKISAIERIVAALDLKNVSLFCGRAEELGRDEAHREQYELVLCRAVAEMNVLLEYAAPFAKAGGSVLLWKSLSIDRELHDSLLARAELFCHLKSQHVYELPETWGKRQILVLRKTSKTSAKYPREVGMPKKLPLK